MFAGVILCQLAKIATAVSSDEEDTFQVLLVNLRTDALEYLDKDSYWLGYCSQQIVLNELRHRNVSDDSDRQTS